MKSNLDSSVLDNAAATAKAIREWLGNYSHPEKYHDVTNLESVRDFVHTIDLLETVLTRFEISAHLAKLALKELETPQRVGSLGWEFWQIDVEEFFASNLLELCYQVENAWETIQGFGDKEKAFDILKDRCRKPSNTIIARHKAAHFQPKDFIEHKVSQKYSILRRPYYIIGGRLEKELAKYTMPKVARLIQDTVVDGMSYIEKFHRATVG